jgi:hypothetical protein
VNEPLGIDLVERRAGAEFGDDAGRDALYKPRVFTPLGAAQWAR